MIPSRSPTQIRSHAQKYFAKLEEHFREYIWQQQHQHEAYVTPLLPRPPIDFASSSSSVVSETTPMSIPSPVSPTSAATFNNSQTRSSVKKNNGQVVAADTTVASMEISKHETSADSTRQKRPYDSTTASATTSTSMRGVVLSLLSSTSARQEAEKILHDPKKIASEVEDILRQLRQRHQDLQQRLERVNTQDQNEKCQGKDSPSQSMSVQVPTETRTCSPFDEKANPTPVSPRPEDDKKHASAESRCHLEMKEVAAVQVLKSRLQS